ncbi:hypothetical protein AKJ09_10805 [Labilithrix luteola]|uniref:Uncharacterized protein n=1 Tax=Labilithrix luteola TaxID=1391654 RepID=A0A0K1QEP3_9BACT|nr:hypothetical protein [Labilithrix luteola]AKV04142.1 hypothetical protein AKJ09_10805 [Labilithrix luteola]
MTRFARFERYIGRLPQGLDSYPDVRCKASVLRTFIDTVDLSGFPFDAAPPAVRTLLQTQFLPTVSLAEAQVMGTLHAVSDYLGYDDAATLRWMDDSNGRLLNGRFFRALMSLAAPSILVTMASRQWGHIHRGTRLTTERSNPPKMFLRFPDHLYDELIARGMATGVRHALSLCRATNPRVEMVSYTPTLVTYHLGWD